VHCYHHSNAPAMIVCLGCLRALCEVCASGHEHYCERGYKPSIGAASTDQPCHHHAFEPPRGICAGCGQPICIRCGGMVDGQLTCPDCRQREDVPSQYGAQAPQAGRGGSRILAVAGVLAAGLVLAVAALLLAGVVALSGSVNAQAGSSGEPAPTDLIQRHYADLAAGEYQAAWQQLSPSAKSQVEFSAWANSYAGTQIAPSALEVASQSPTSATVVGDVTISSGSTVASLGRGQWTLTLVDGAWRLDTTIFTSATDSSSASRSR
jgi:hypothetical protein